MIDSEVVLIAVGIGRTTGIVIHACLAANPAISRGVEAIADRVVVRHRHSSDQLWHESGWIKARTQGITSEHAECRERAHRTAGRDHVALNIHDRVA